jgi:hypothetical protein
VRETVERMPSRTPRNIAEVLEIDRKSREQARSLVQACAGATCA